MPPIIQIFEGVEQGKPTEFINSYTTAYTFRRTCIGLAEELGGWASLITCNLSPYCQVFLGFKAYVFSYQKQAGNKDEEGQEGHTEDDGHKGISEGKGARDDGIARARTHTHKHAGSTTTAMGINQGLALRNTCVHHLPNAPSSAASVTNLYRNKQGWKWRWQDLA
eukprot:scaffold161393_cov16-Tisochrysis_lutea.AAC.1